MGFKATDRLLEKKILYINYLNLKIEVGFDNQSILTSSSFYDGIKRSKNSKQKTQKSNLWRSKCEPSLFEFEFIKWYFPAN